MKGTVAVIILLSFSQEQAEPAGIQVPLNVHRVQQGWALAAQGTLLCHPRALGSACSVCHSPLGKTSWAGCGKTNQQWAEHAQFLKFLQHLKFLQT